jgi:hypothetical protein
LLQWDGTAPSVAANGKHARRGMPLVAVNAALFAVNNGENGDLSNLRKRNFRHAKLPRSRGSEVVLFEIAWRAEAL